MKTNSQTVNHTYQVRGEGGQGACVAVQSVLQEHGLCGYTEWSSLEWRFLYLTHLESRAILGLLGDLTKHFGIHIENSSTHL